MCADKLAALPFEMTFLKPLQADSNGIATFKTRPAPNIKHHSQRHHAKFHKAQLHWSAPVCLLNNFSVLEVILHREDTSITLVNELVREFKFMHYVSRSSKCPHAIVIKKLSVELQAGAGHLLSFVRKPGCRTRGQGFLQGCTLQTAQREACHYHTARAQSRLMWITGAAPTYLRGVQGHAQFS